MDFEVGTIHAGKITGITDFGAFVTMAPGKSGLVHISEVAATYVNDVRDHLTIGQDVMVKVIGVDKTGRLNLSIKATVPPPEDKPRRDTAARRDAAPKAAKERQERQTELSFEDKLKRFMQDSNNKISSLKQHSDKKNARRRNR